MNPGSIPAATRPTNLTSTPDSLCLRQLIYLISPIKLRARTHTYCHPSSARMCRQCCTYTVARPCVPPAHEHARNRSHMVHNARLIPGENRREVNLLTAIGSSRCWPQVPPENRSVSGMRFNPLLHTYIVYCRVTKDERYFSTGYIRSVSRSVSFIRMLYARFVHISTYFTTRVVISQLCSSISA